MDMDAAVDSLVQEARELLAAMEVALMELEANDGADPSGESINSIFRAAHTIKGSAGLFAYDKVVSFTHIVESVLDRVRTREVAVDGALLSLLLQCGDYIKTLIDAIENRDAEREPNTAKRSTLELELSHYLPQPEATPATTLAEHPGPEVGVEGGERVSGDNWHISLRFNEDVLRNGLDPLSFIRYLGTLGRIVYVATLVDGLPDAAQMDPESSYLGYEIDFQTDADRAAIEGAFEFVRAESQIRILPPHSKIEEYLALIDSLTESHSRLGEILIAGGALTPNELAAMLEQQSRHAIAPKPLGAMLVDNQVVPSAVVAAALGKQKQGEEKRSQEQKFIKVEVSKLDKLIDLVGELVIAGAGANTVAKLKRDAAFEEATQTVSSLVEDIRDAALTLRMVPIGEVFMRFPRVVRDVSKELEKDIELVITGADTELDKSMVEKLADPLMHIVRNAMDHGIETPDVRVASGKSPNGTMRLNAYHDSGSIMIEVSDDGRGLNRERILAKAIERGLVEPDQVLTESEIYRLIFEPGFSTAEQVTNLSGRGVGMDVVRKNIEALRGEVEVLSEPGEGATARIRLPLTLAIIDGFQVMAGGAVFVIPQDMVVECLDLSSHSYSKDNDIIRVRGEALPFVRLREVFDMPPNTEARESLVVVVHGQYRAGLVVDKLLGEFQAVIKPLGPLFRHFRGLSGSTILGTGAVALVLDVPALIQKMDRRSVDHKSSDKRTAGLLLN